MLKLDVGPFPTFFHFRVFRNSVYSAFLLVEFHEMINNDANIKF